MDGKIRLIYLDGWNLYQRIINITANLFNDRMKVESEVARAAFVYQTLEP